MDRLVSDTRFAMVLGVAVAVTAAVYVAFGPPSMESSLTIKDSDRKKGRRRRFSGQPRGLHNAGNTCFVNAVLQATAACPAMLLWLEERRNELLQQNKEISTSIRSEVEGNDVSHKSRKLDDSMSILQLALLRVLRVANGNVGHTDGDESDRKDDSDSEIWAPATLFRALRTHGWIINTDEQDAHEFFQVLLSTVEEELQKRPKIHSTSLFDTSGIGSLLVTDRGPIEGMEGKDVEKNAALNSLDLSSPAIKTSDVSESDVDDKTDPFDEKIRTGCRSTKRQRSRHKRTPCSRSSSGVFVRSGEELSIESLMKQTRLAVASSTPFTGTLTNKVSFRCTGKCKSPTSSTIFNNITLNLPNPNVEGSLNTYSWVSGVTAAPVTLETLLHMFVSVEAVSSATAANNQESTTESNDRNGINVNKENDAKDLVKQLTFARLPECICFHIQRTAFENGIPRKRNDPVLFPPFLNMDNYAYNRQISKTKMLKQVSSNEFSQQESEICAQSPLDAGALSHASSNFLSPEDDNSLMTSSISSNLSNISKHSFNNNYDLRAVVVHLGAIDSGHYVTYRREPETSSDVSSNPKWFYTSDSLVREVTIDEVLNTNPYMLFYERSPITDLKYSH